MKLFEKGEQVLLKAVVYRENERGKPPELTLQCDALTVYQLRTVPQKISLMVARDQVLRKDKSIPDDDVCCQKCVFWNDANTETAECRFRPPSVGPSKRSSIWPRTRKSDWCGCFKRKTDEPDRKTDLGNLFG